MREVAESFGYEEYNASILEPADLYRAKTGEEIVSNETYTFTDRGDREVTLRPEMTPTLARMIAAKRKELQFPIRWYSIPNLFRYEKPQRGRLREHWQLNADIFGVPGIEAEVEVISMASAIMRAFGMKDENFEVRISNRAIINFLLGDVLTLSDDLAHKVSKLIDKKAKMEPHAFAQALEILIENKSEALLSFLGAKSIAELGKLIGQKMLPDAFATTEKLMERLKAVGIQNAVFDLSLMRGFDYYTGPVFEVFDKNPENSRSVFGGGRYDDLLDIFGEAKVPAVGFGAGDVILRDLLETYNLLPEAKSATDLYLCVIGDETRSYAEQFADKLRAKGVNVAVDLTKKKVGDQIRYADKKKIPFIACIGEEEMKTGQLKVKNLKTGEEQSGTIDSLAGLLGKK
jgi:histidyl-tRNA synthetase